MGLLGGFVAGEVVVEVVIDLLWLRSDYWRGKALHRPERYAQAECVVGIGEVSVGGGYELFPPSDSSGGRWRR